MTGITLGGSPRILLTHMALYGLAAICEERHPSDVRLSWTAGMSPRAHVDLDLTSDQIAQLVLDHADRHAAPDAWPQERISLAGNERGLMSPRLGGLDREQGRGTVFEPDTWAELQQRRHGVLDALTTGRGDLDLRLLAALGEPCYWQCVADPRNHRARQDYATSRLEMQPRNSGSEFVGSRLSRLAAAVAKRSPQVVLAGLLGTHTQDEIGKNRPDSLTATGMAEPGPTDNALAWCALWGISQTPLVLKTARHTPDPRSHFIRAERARTATATTYEETEYFYAPMWQRPLHPARLRTLLASDPLRLLTESHLADTGEVIRGHGLPAKAQSARLWLSRHHLTALLTFPVHIHGSKSAPERRAGQGVLHPLVATRS
jgi:CRISPR-associated protein Csb3